MHLPTLLTTAALAALSTSTPLISRQPPSTVPPRVSTPYFTLIANVSSPPGTAPPTQYHHWALHFPRTGAGIWSAALTPDLASNGTVLLLNGTSRDISAQATTVMTPPILLNVGPTAVGMRFRSGAGAAAALQWEVGLGLGRGDEGTGIGTGLRDLYPRLFVPAGLAQDGWFVVCDERRTTTRPEYPVYWVRKGASGLEKCVRIDLLAQVAKAPEGGIVGEKELGLVNGGVGAYEDVRGVEWESGRRGGW